MKQSRKQAAFLDRFVPRDDAKRLSEPSESLIGYRLALSEASDDLSEHRLTLSVASDGLPECRLTLSEASDDATMFAERVNGFCK